MAKIRRPDFAGGGLTGDERRQMADHVRLWVARAMRTDPIEPDKIVPAIKGIYRAANLPEPRVVIVPSPYVMALAYGFSAAIWYIRERGAAVATDATTRGAMYTATYTATEAATDTATRDATYAATYATRDATDDATCAATHTGALAGAHAATDAATDAATRAATVAATDAATYAATRAATVAATVAATYAATDAAMDASTGMAQFFLGCAARWSAAYQGGNMWVAWECYLTAARDILGLRLPQHEAYAAWEQAAIHGGFRCMHEKFCIVSDFPEILKVDDQNLPHSENGPSHRWRDGWSIYHWHGVRVPAEWIEEKRALSATIALSQKNTELRRAACEIVGWDRILSELRGKSIDRDPDPEIGELVEVDLPDAPRSRFLRVLCGTGRRFAIPVPGDIPTALAANAWTYDLPTNLLQQKENRT